MKLRSLFALALVASPLTAQNFDWSITNLMRGPELYGREPQNVRWTPNGQSIWFEWLPAGSDWRERPKTYRVAARAGATPELVSDAAIDSAAPLFAAGVRSSDGTRRVVSARGDLWLVALPSGALTRLTATIADETAVKFTTDSRRVLFVRDGNGYELDPATGLTRQLTDIRVGPAPREDAAARGQRGALEADQRQLLEVIRDRARADSLARNERKRLEALRPPTVYLNTGERVLQLDLAPTGRSAVLVTTSVSGSRAADVPNYVTANGYSEMIPARDKVGDVQAPRRIGILTIATGAVRWINAIPGDSMRAGTQARSMGWNSDGSAVGIWATSADFKTRYIHTLRGDSLTLATIDILRDSAWVGGPCFGCSGWIDDATLWYVSEQTGYAHLYRQRIDGSDRRALTSGQWEVRQVELLPDRKQFLLHSSEVSPFDRNAYRLSVDGGERRPITSSIGGHTVALSPDGKGYADVFSTANRPPELFVSLDGKETSARAVTVSPTAAWLAAGFIVPPIIRIPASDGVQVPARLYDPKQFGVAPNGAAVIFVHGAGYAHNVHNYWASYAREYQFHHLLAKQGYVVLDVDYRASDGYGRDWRTAIYRFMGGRDLQDHVDASAWLTKTYGVPAERIGIYGGSYGGFMTLMALFTAPKSFGAGAALRPVTDWAHYNHPYTGQILNLPQNDTIAYRRSSPIFHAGGLEDPLLIAHGMVDVNVHYQDAVRLTQKLIELGKTDWELASYPVEDHGFVRPSSWTDEYRRIFELFERTIGPKGSKAKP
ncbi:MAG: prolyl oligopeptidase family serine peptidase [Gemmatimonadaceae bacterium]|nr:prolyl oligopeptidase family serine peptidase [Gemmatimonadaceae bacterium]